MAHKGVGALLIDFHHHLLNEADYVECLVEHCRALGIDRVCCSGLGLPSRNWLGDLSPDNDDVLAAMNRYPDTILGLGVVRLGRDGPEVVDRLRAQGFVGLKITRPPRRYDDRAFWPVYARAEALGLPILFHTGFVLPTDRDAQDEVSSEHMRPVCLDLVARRFPALRFVAAHLGMPWHEEAAMLARYHPNAYVDLTGSPAGWRNRHAPAWFADQMYWDGAFGKVVFGTDVHWRDMEAALADHRRILALCNVPAVVQAGIFGGTVAGWLGGPGRGPGGDGGTASGAAV